VDDQFCLLIVDDEPDIRDVLQTTFEDEGFRVLVAENGERALRVIEEASDIDAILSDIAMPELNGIEFLRELGKQGCETPLVLLTAYGTRDNVISALRLGAFDFLDKPFKPEKLIGVMSQAARLGRRLREHEANMQKLREAGDLNDDQYVKVYETRKSILKSRFESGGSGETT
jgi:DNA-binding NtrC family response regulator